MNGFLASEEILKSDALHVFQAFEKRVHIDVLLNDISDLCVYLVICYRTIDYIIVMNVDRTLVLTVGKDERGPIFGITIDSLGLALVNRQEIYICPMIELHTSATP